MTEAMVNRSRRRSRRCLGDHKAASTGGALGVAAGLLFFAGGCVEAEGDQSSLARACPAWVESDANSEEVAAASLLWEGLNSPDGAPTLLQSDDNELASISLNFEIGQADGWSHLEYPPDAYVQPACPESPVIQAVAPGTAVVAVADGEDAIECSEPSLAALAAWLESGGVGMDLSCDFDPSESVESRWLASAEQRLGRPIAEVQGWTLYVDQLDGEGEVSVAVVVIQEFSGGEEQGTTTLVVHRGEWGS